MTKTGANASLLSDERKSGFEVTKELFMLNAMLRPNELGPRRVLELETYEAKQTDLCAAMGADFLNKPGVEEIVIEKAIRSNCILGNRLDIKDEKLYFHGNFIAKSKSGDKRCFFTEVQGHKRPEEVLCCTDVTENGVNGNCKFCTGIKHPVQENFVGKI